MDRAEQMREAAASYHDETADILEKDDVKNGGNVRGAADLAKRHRADASAIRALPLPPAPPLDADVAEFMKWLKGEIYVILGPEGASYSEEPVAVYAQAETLIERLARDNQELLANEGKWRWEYEAVMVAIAQKGGTIHAPTQDAYDAVCAARDKWQARAEKAEAEVARLRDALIWCSGSDDFQDGGKAREGWLKLCAPLIHSKGADHEL